MLPVRLPAHTTVPASCGCLQPIATTNAPIGQHIPKHTPTKTSTNTRTPLTHLAWPLLRWSCNRVCAQAQPLRPPHHLLGLWWRTAKHVGTILCRKSVRNKAMCVWCVNCVKCVDCATLRVSCCVKKAPPPYQLTSTSCRLRPTPWPSDQPRPRSSAFPNSSTGSDS